MAARILALVAFLGLFAVVFEITARVEDLVRFGTPIFSPYTDQTDLILQDEFGARGRPNARFQKWVLNSIGTRGPEVAPTKAPGVVRVVTAGASETFGLYETPSREYPRQLEDSLSVSLTRLSCVPAQRPQRAEVVNAALPGMSLPTVSLDVKHRIASLRPDFIVYYPTPAQYLDELPPGAVARGVPTTEVPPLTRALYPRSWARLRSQLKAMLPSVAQTWVRQREVKTILRSRPAGWQFTSVPNDRVELFDQDLRRMVGTIRATGAVPILATNSNAFLGADPSGVEVLYAWERFTPRATGQVILAFDSVSREIVRQVGRDSAVAVAEVDKAVRGRAAFADFLHFTDAGAAAVARVLTEAIVGELQRTSCGAVGTAGSTAAPPDRAAAGAGARSCPAGARAECTPGIGTSSNTPG